MRMVCPARRAALRGPPPRLSPLSLPPTWLAVGRALPMDPADPNTTPPTSSEGGPPPPSMSTTTTVKLSKEDEEYLDKLLSEKRAVDGLLPDAPGRLECTLKLLNSEIERVLSGNSKDPSGGSSSSSKRFCDVTKDKPIKVTVRTTVPTRDHPKFNFVGKLLGPKGNSLKRLQEETLTKMAILGRGSMRDKHKEEEYRLSHEPRYKHLNDDLHVEITAYAAPAEAHARIALALTEIRRFLVPDYNDDIRQEQLREMQMMNGTSSNSTSSSSSSTSSSSNSEPDGRTSCGGGGPGPGNVMLATPLHQHLSAMAAGMAAGHPLRAVPYPPVLPLMHPALRGLCKGPGQSPAALAIAGAAAAASAASLLNRYGRGPGGSTAGGAAPPAGGGMLAGTCGAPTGMVNLNQRRTNLTGSSMNRAGGLKDDYCSPQDGTTSSSSSTSSDPNVAFLELYHRYNLPYGGEGSDGVASPDDRDETMSEATADLLASANVVTAEFLDGSGGGGPLKLTPAGLDRSRYRHDPYARYPSKVVT